MLWPPALEVAIQSEIVRILSAIMGSDFGLVQAIYFDKPPDLPWSLPWHQDVAIAVKEHRIQSRRFGAPTVKQGVPHVEADAELLETMVTVRIHLDDVTEENGPLEVIPGSHRRGLIPSSFSPDPGEGRKVLLNAGDALLMRPLLLHHSGSSKRGTNLHRRLLHFEYAPSPFLSDGYEWHNFIAADKKTDRSISCNHGGTANH
ncbi:phytanoyl-CoA dioxygenase family protein [Candidatus Sumerlaeota bacterium]|nr:phytanoyl-CoA dioxygenase family protein [Candidatus Sumerlaeota bacterium]